MYSTGMNSERDAVSAPLAGLRQCIGSSYRPAMVTTRKTPQHTVAIDDELWVALKAAAEVAGYDRPGVIRQFVRWYLRTPGAKLPQRPAEAG